MARTSLRNQAEAPARKVEPASRAAHREKRRRQLIEATIATIAEQGLNDTTLTTVTKRAGLSHGTVNFHFETKQLLLAETLKYLSEEHYGQWRAAFAAAGPRPERKLAAITLIDFDPVMCNPERLSVWFAFWGEIKSRPLYQEMCSPFDQERLGTFKDLCREIDAEGRYGHADPDLIASSLQSLIDGIWLNMLCEPEVYGLADGRRMFLSFLATSFPRHFPLAGD